MAKKTKKQKDKERVDKDVRPYPNPFFKNHDYAAEPGDKGPGPGLYTGKFKHKSVKEYREEQAKRRKRRLDRLDAWNYLLGMLKEAGVEN